MKHGLSLILVLLMGCASFTPDRVAVLAAIAGQAAQIGAESWLAKHPDHREAFNLVLAAIRALVAQGVSDPAKYAELLDSLPPQLYLTAPAGDLMWSGASKTGYMTARLFVWDGELQKSVPLTGKEVLPVMQAAVTGLRRAVAEKPPALPMKSKNEFSEPYPGAWEIHMNSNGTMRIKSK